MLDSQQSAPHHLHGQAQANHAAAVTANAGSSFFWGMRILPKPRREAMYAIYAFCREVDDIADGPDPAPRRIERLNEWRAEVNRVFEGGPKTLTGRALVQPVRDFGLERGDFLAVIDGVAMDAREEMCAPPAATLQQYCARVAGAVGLLSIRAFGDGSPRARDLALALGEALQLTNILRDLREDAARGRLYLARELLEKHGITTRDPAEVLDHPALPGVCAELAERAAAKFAEAKAALRDCDRRALRPAVIMMTIYRRILDKLLKRGWHRLDEPIEVAKPEKIWIALRHGIL
ncbi:MAG TPA: presqualene diphosphate synthase HpnD [Alphaproteobacteria bacterium]|jgi:phytoene synthase|nr:presqualene diphosphate synthase HpnD [Alphaproteobacteria bacterium]